MATKIEKAVLLDLTALRILHASSKESFCKVMEKFAEIVLQIDDNVSGLTAMETEVLKVLVERANEGIESMRKRTAGLKQYKNDGKRQMDPITSKDLGGRNL